MRTTYPSSVPIRLGRVSGALCALVLLASATARAQAPAARSVPGGESTAGEPAPPFRVERIAPFDRQRVYHSSEDDGTPWVRGATYKVRFGAEGVSYTPFLGSQAPRNFPVSFRVASVSIGGDPLGFDDGAVAARAGDGVRYERGSLTEAYAIDVESIEQTFVFDTLPSRGEIVVRIAVESELAGRELPERIQFENELGSVRYGRATAIDANGASVSAPTSLTEQGIEIRVPADFVARARMPLTIDPIMSTFSIDTNPPDAFLPDCAYDVDNACWLVVHEEVFSVSDHDVVWRRLAAFAPVSLGSGYVDTNLSEYWAQPACANNNWLDRFFVVASVGMPTTGVKRKILGKTIEASNGAFGTTLNIGAEDPLVDLFNPDVGGDPFGAPSYFLVVWEKIHSSSDHDIYSRLVDPGNSLASGIQIVDVSAGTHDRHPSISKSSDGSAWNIVWSRLVVASPSHDDLRGARVGWAGNTIASSFPIDSSSWSTHSPSASTSLRGTDRWAVAYQTNQGGEPDVHLKLLDGTAVLDEMNLSETEALAGGLATLDQWQARPDVDSDGKSFAVAYAESTGVSPLFSDIYAATVAVVGTELHLSEGHQQITASSNNEDQASIASVRGSGVDWSLELIVATSEPIPGPGDIVGGLYDNAVYASFCHATYDGVPSCPCGNDPGAYGRGCDNSAATGGAQLVPSGVSSLEFDSLVLTSQFGMPNALSIFNQGNAVFAPALPFGQGLRCAGGSLKRLYMKTASASGTASAPDVGDPSVHERSAALGDPITSGSTRVYYVYYRDPVVLGGCSSSGTFNTTQTVQAIWIQ